MVFITPDEKVKTIFEQSGTNTAEILVPTGASRLKMVGLNAKGKLSFSFRHKGKMEVKTP